MNTNERSLVSFMQYGDKKVLHVNGSIKQAKSKLKSLTGIKEVIQEKTYTSCGFLRVGWYSITEYEDRYFI